MSPAEELTELAAHKAALRRRIATRRAACAEGIARIAQPVALLDQVHALWRDVSPLARSLVLPIGLLLGRSAAPRTGIFGRLLRWSPVIFATWRSLGAATRRPR